MNDQDSKICMLEQKTIIPHLLLRAYGIITRPTTCEHGLNMFRLWFLKEEQKRIPQDKTLGTGIWR